MWKPEHRRAADRTGLRYPSDLTDAEWVIVEPMIPPAFVIDHMGYIATAGGLDDPGFQELCKAAEKLLKEADCWVKISGANRISSEPIPYRDTIPFARTLVAARPERVVWGSDWPHVAIKGPMANDGVLLDLLAEWVPDEATRNRILVDNPAALYAF